MDEAATAALLSKLKAAAERVSKQHAPSGPTRLTPHLADEWHIVLENCVQVLARLESALLSAPDPPASAARAVTLLGQVGFCRTMQQALSTAQGVDPQDLKDDLMRDNAVVGRAVLRLLALILKPLLQPYEDSGPGQELVRTSLPAHIQKRRKTLISQITTSGIWAACIKSIAGRFYHHPANPAADGADTARPFLVSEAGFSGDNAAEAMLFIPDDRAASTVWSAMAAHEAAELHEQYNEQYAGQYVASLSSAEPGPPSSLSGRVGAGLRLGPSWMVEVLACQEVQSFLLARILRACVHLAGSCLHEEWGVKLLGLGIEQRNLGAGPNHPERLREEEHLYMYELGSYANTFAALIPSWSRLPLPDALRLVAEVARCSLAFAIRSSSSTAAAASVPLQEFNFAASNLNVQQAVLQCLSTLRLLWDHLDDHCAELIPIQGALSLKMLMSTIAQPCLMALHGTLPAYGLLLSTLGQETQTLTLTILQSAVVLLKRILAPEYNHRIDAASGGEYERARKAVVGELEGLPALLEAAIRGFVQYEPGFQKVELLAGQLQNVASALRLIILCVEDAPGLLPAGGPEVLSLASSLRKLLGCFSSDSLCWSQRHAWTCSSFKAADQPRWEKLLHMLDGTLRHDVLEGTELALGLSHALFERESAADAAAKGRTVHAKLGMALSFALLPACTAAASKLLPPSSAPPSAAGRPLDPGLVIICEWLPSVCDWILRSFWEVLGVASGYHLLLMQVSKAVVLSECSSGSGGSGDDLSLCMWNCRAALESLSGPLRPILADSPAPWRITSCHRDCTMYAHLLLSDLPAMAALKELSSGAFLGPGRVMGPGGRRLQRQAAAAVAELEAVRLILQQDSAPDPPGLNLAAGYDVALLRLPEKLRQAAGCANPHCQNAQGSSEAALACKKCGKCGSRYCSVQCQRSSYPVHKHACAGQVQQYMDELMSGR